MNRLNGLVQQLNQATSEENQDTAFLQDIALQIQGVAEYFGMKVPAAGGAATPTNAAPAPAPAEATAAPAGSAPAPMAAAPAPTPEAAPAGPGLTWPRKSRTLRSGLSPADTHETYHARMKEKFPEATDDQIKAKFDEWTTRRRTKKALPVAASSRVFVKLAK